VLHDANDVPSGFETDCTVTNRKRFDFVQRTGSDCALSVIALTMCEIFFIPVREMRFRIGIAFA